MSKAFVRYSFFLLAAILTSCLQEKGVSPGNATTFVRYFNGGNNDEAVSVEELSDGGFIVLGTIGIASSDLGTTTYKMDLIRTDPFGNETWHQVFPAFGSDTDTVTTISCRPRALYVEENGGYIIACDRIDASGNPNMLLLETDADGNVQQQKEVPDMPGLSAVAMAVSSQGELRVLASINNGGADNMEALGFDSGLNLVWNRAYGAGQSTLAHKLVINSNDELIWSGTVTRNNRSDIRLIRAMPDAPVADFDQTIGQPEYDEQGVDMCTYGSLLAVLGTTNQKESGVGDRDILFQLIDAGGTTVARSQFGFPNQDDEANSIAPANSGGFIILGTITSGLIDNQIVGRGENDYYLVKTDAFGSIQWTQVFGSQKNDEGSTVRPTSDGGYVVLGTTEFGGLQTIMLMKTDSNGEIR